MHLLSNCLPGFHHCIDVVHGLDRMFDLKTALESAGGVFSRFFHGNFTVVVDTFGVVVDTFGVELTVTSR